MTKKKFKIMYPESDKEFKPPQGSMIVMNNQGVFFVVEGMNDYYTTVVPLYSKIYKYDVVWK